MRYPSHMTEWHRFFAYAGGNGWGAVTVDIDLEEYESWAPHWETWLVASRASSSDMCDWMAWKRDHGPCSRHEEESE